MRTPEQQAQFLKEKRFATSGLRLGRPNALLAAIAVACLLEDVIQGITALRHWKLPSARPVYYVFGMVILFWLGTVASHYRASKDRAEAKARDAVAMTTYALFIGFSVTISALFEVIIDLSKRM